MWLWIALAVLLYFVCAVLIVAEIFVPSGGLISIVALFCLVGGLLIFFKIDEIPRWAGIVIAAVEIPIVLVGTYKLFPKTKFGKSVTLEPPDRQKGDAVPDTDEIKHLLGKQGMVMTVLRPVGIVDFDGQRLECVAENGYVDANSKVEVIKVQSTQITVRVVNKQ